MGSGSPEKPRPKPIEEVLPSADLLAHYRSRIDQFEQERDELLRAVERCAVQHDDVHRLEWENRKRADEIKELQKALSDAQQFLFEERQRLLLLQAENDELKLQELQDRQRIQQLLALEQPLEQAITLKPNTLPSSVTAYPRPYVRGSGQQQQQQHAEGDSSAAAAAAAAGKGRAAGGAGRGERVLRTVFLPAVDPDALLLKLESLQAQLNEQRQLHEERVAALLSDRQLRSQEEERQRSNLVVQVESLSRQVQQLEETLRTTTRDYILARREKQEAQAAAAAAQAQMVAEVSAARAELAAARRQARADVERAAAAADSKMHDYVDKFREQVRSREEELTQLTALHTATKAAADKRIADLDSRVTKLLEANRQLELRRQLDVDGWAADVTALRKTLAVVDRKLLQMRLIERLDDDERLDALLDQLEKRVPGAKQQQQQQSAAARPASTGRMPQRQQQQQRDPAIKRRLSSTAGRSAAAVAGRLQRPAGGAAAGAGRRDQGGSVGGHAAAGLRPASADSADSMAAQVAEVLLRQGLGGDGGSDDGGGGDTDTAASSSVKGGSSSVKSGLAAELREVRQQLEELELRAAGKARRALAALHP